MKISYRNTKNVDMFLSLLMAKHAKIKILLPLHWIPSTGLMLSPTVLTLSPAPSDVISPVYWVPSTVLKLSPTVLILSPIVLNNLHSTEGIPHSTQGILTCTAVTPTVLKVSIHSTHVIPHCTEQPPQYWSYPPHYWCCSPDVLNSLQCTEQPPLHWTNIKWSECCCKLKESREGRNGSRVLRSKTRVWSKARVGQGQRSVGLSRHPSSISCEIFTLSLL